MKNFTSMGLAEMEDFLLENAILISRCQENNKNVFVYIAGDTFYKVIGQPLTNHFESITPVKDSKDLREYFSRGEARNLFFYNVCKN